MKYLIALALIGILSAGCSPALPANQPPNDTASGNSDSASGATAAATPEGADLSSAPLAITVRPPMLFVGPIPGTPSASVAPAPISPALEGWQTLTSSNLGVAIDYPSDWIIDQQDEIVTFTSPQGTTILLQMVAASDDGNQATSGNQDCATLINSYGLSAVACGDLATSTYSARFNLESADGSTKRLILSTTDQAAIDVYTLMLNSARQTP